MKQTATLNVPKYINNYLSYIDVNECKESNGGCSHTCVNLPGSFQCRCPSGATLGADKKTCTGNWTVIFYVYFLCKKNVNIR